MKTLNKNEVKKYLYKNKELVAIFTYYASGSLYYAVRLEDGFYQFPVAISDLGDTVFDSEIKASFLNRWVDMAISNDEFIKI